MEQTTGSTNPAPPARDAAADSGNPGDRTTLDRIVAGLAREYPQAVTESGPGIDMPTIRVRMDDWVAACRWLRDAPDLKYTLIDDLTCVDFLQREPRFELVLHLYSFDSHSWVRVKCGVPAEPCEAPTLVDVWPGANWLEREIWDMYGIRFTGHPDLRRILTPDGWQYFALRRDFPLQGPGMIKLFDSVKDVF